MTPTLRRVPWKNGVFNLPPAGLRETVVRVAFMQSCYLPTIRPSAGLLYTVAQWRLTRAARWTELQHLCGVPAGTARGAVA